MVGRDAERHEYYAVGLPIVCRTGLDNFCEIYTSRGRATISRGTETTARAGVDSKLRYCLYIQGVVPGGFGDMVIDPDLEKSTVSAGQE